VVQLLDSAGNPLKASDTAHRTALLETWRTFSAQRQWLATYWARPVYELWLEKAINRGLIESSEAVAAKLDRQLQNSYNAIERDSVVTNPDTGALFYSANSPP